MFTDSTAIERGPGWALQRVAHIALGVFDGPLRAQTVALCHGHHEAATRAYGRVSVLAIFHTTPFPADPRQSQVVLRQTVRLLEEFREQRDVVIAVLTATGFQGSLARTGSAAIARVVARRVPVLFPATVEHGLSLARVRGMFADTEERLISDRLDELTRAARSAGP